MEKKKVPGSRRMLNYKYEEYQHLLYWPESPRFQHAKIENKKNMNYTMPGIKEEFIRNPIDYRFQETFNKFFSQYDLELNQKGLVWFMKKGLLDAALNGTSDLLTWLGQGKDKAGRSSKLTQVTMEIWALRFQLLLSLRMHAQLLAELAAFEELDAPDLYYQYHFPDKTGSLVPFVLRLIHAEALRFSPFPWKSMVRIQKLILEVEQIVEHFKSINAPERHISDWVARLESVKLLSARVLHDLGEYKQAMNLMEQLRRVARNPNEKIVLALTMMRMAMQAGDEKAMNIYGEKANTAVGGTIEMTVHKCIRSIFLGAYSHAHEYMKKLKSIDCTAPQMINTSSIVQLYLGRGREAVETIHQIKPMLAGPTTTNLKTMAELCYSTAAKDELLIAS